MMVVAINAASTPLTSTNAMMDSQMMPDDDLVIKMQNVIVKKSRWIIIGNNMRTNAFAYHTHTHTHTYIYPTKPHGEASKAK